MNKQSVMDFEQETPLSFCIYTGMFLECVGIIKKNNNLAEETEDNTENDSNDTLSHQFNRVQYCTK